MSLVKTFSVGEGDTSYIVHNSDNFTIIDCCLNEYNKVEVVEELIEAAKRKGIRRFISTHPDEDHFGGIEYLDEKFGIDNFYVVKNNAKKTKDTDSFKHYCKLRDGSKAFFISKGCSRRWMNRSSDERKTSGIEILWPDPDNEDFKAVLEKAEAETHFNNLSAVIRYSVEGGQSFLWLGDLETEFMERIEAFINLPKTKVIFASHHGRDSGKIPNTWLEKLEPKVIIIGEAPSRHLNYYTGYNTITQNSAGDIIMDAVENRIDFYVGNQSYAKRDWLVDEGRSKYPNYVGTLHM